MPDPRPVAPQPPLAPPSFAAGSTAAAPSPVERQETGRRRPVFRWLLLAGVLVTALGVWGGNSADQDPLIELTVLEEESSGACTVRFTDPFDGRSRTEAFVCDSERSELLYDWDLAWVVSYGPWKGDLYNSDWQGTPSNHVVVTVLLCGAGLLAVGGIGGTVRGVGRLRRRWRPADADEAAWAQSPGLGARVSLVKQSDEEEPPPASELTYGSLAALARATEKPQALPWTQPVFEGDVRGVPWWRVRSLLVLSGLYEVGKNTAAVVGAVALAVFLVGIPGYLMAAMFGLAAVRAGWGAWHNVPAARLIEQAARQPADRRVRYVMLRRAADDAPVMALFPAVDAEADSEADGEAAGAGQAPTELLEVRIPGTSGKQVERAPAPEGIAELRYAPADRDIVVPFVEGMPLWPMHPVWRLDPEAPKGEEGAVAEEYLRELVEDARHVMPRDRPMKQDQ
ncbi:hypothetical protein [Streptomyces sp. KLOTTS4A1]|uniref:hypothetical protein n=1 Tax=Streptomyces sp. KLOTTS4A1 TaxID=3390996 RepID=UPI0039F5E9B4